MIVPATIRPRAKAPPTAIPAMAPVARVGEDLEPRVYFRLNNWEVITLMEAPGEGSAVGGLTGFEAVVKQGVSPLTAEE